MPSIFLPSQHGFKFANRFLGLPLPPIFKAGDLLGSNQQTSCHGLCGGMCFAALDWMQAGGKVPQHLETPLPGSSLYHYLYRRQIDTYGNFWTVVAKFLQWSLLPNLRLPALTLDQAYYVISSIKNNQPAVLGLILTQSAAIWQNHQVIAYRYEEEAEISRIYIYDPNVPENDEIWIEFPRQVQQPFFRLASQKSTKTLALRGFFIIPYTYQKPPNI